MAIYRRGTVNITPGSAIVEGYGTTWRQFVQRGYIFKLPLEPTWYEIATVDSDTQLTLTSKYANRSYNRYRLENIASTNNATKVYSGTLGYTPVIQTFVVINASSIRYTDNGAGILTGTPVTGTPVGTIDYDTGAWTINTATTYTASVNVTASYFSGQEITSAEYRIVTDYTSRLGLPEMSGNDVNFQNIYTKAVRMIDSAFLDFTSSSVTATYLIAGGLTYPIVDGNASDCLVTDGAGNLSWESREDVSGESNTATNILASGVGVYDNKSGVQFRLRTINAGSSKNTVTLNASTVEIDTDESQLDITNMVQTGHITTLTSNDITATALTAGGVDLVAHVSDVSTHGCDATILDADDIGVSVLAQQTIGIADNNLVEIDDTDAAANDYCKLTANGIEGKSYAEVRSDINVADGADVTGNNAPQAHKDLHDPNDGSDALDTAAGANLDGVQAGATGTSHSFSRSDHAHRIQHSIADNAILTIDDASAADNDYGRFTANGMEGIPRATALTDLLSVALAENDSIILDSALSADGKYNGVTEAGVAGATLAFGDLCYLAVADSRWELADADAEATAGPVKLGICVLAAGSDGDATKMLLWGKVRADTAFPALTVGATVHVGTTAGDIQVAAPSGSGDIVRIVGKGNTADELFFNPDETYLELV